MSTYLLRRAGTSIVILIGLSIMIFAMLHLIGGSPGQIILGPKASRASVAAWDQRNGFDRPFIAQYGHYMWQLLHGNLGESYTLNQSVDQVIAEHAPISAYLSGTALILSIIIAFPIGIYQALKRNTLGDNAVTTAAFVLYSMPTFLLGLLLIQIFALTLNILPPDAPFSVSQSSSLWGAITHPNGMVLPVATLTMVQVAGYSRYMRSSALDALAQDYIKAARAKGLPERLVLRATCAQRLPADGDADRPVHPGAAVRQPDHRERVQLARPRPACSSTRSSGRTTTVLLAYTLMGGVLTVIGNLRRRHRADGRRPAHPDRLTCGTVEMRHPGGRSDHHRPFRR